MGKYGQAILTIGGYIVGSFFGNPALGAFLGSLAGGLLFPPKLPTIQGPRLSDISQTNSTVGAPIPRGWGTFPAAGNIIWQSDLREVVTTEEVGGKGGPSQEVETVTYFQDFAIGLNDGLIGGVRRIWANGKIIYDRRPLQPGESDADFDARMAASDAIDAIMVVYLGTEDQLPDPTMQAALGVDEVSAFRGLAYVVMVNWQNKPEDGNKMPINWKFELFTDAAVEDATDTEYSNYVLYPWLPAHNPVNLANLHTCQAITGHLPGDIIPGAFSSVAQAEAAITSAVGCAPGSYIGYNIIPYAGLYGIRGILNVTNGGEYHDVALYDVVNVGLHYNTQAIKTFALRNGAFSIITDVLAKGLAPGHIVHMNGSFASWASGGAGAWIWWGGCLPDAGAYRNATCEIHNAISTGQTCAGTPDPNLPGAVLLSRDSVVVVQRVPRAPPDPCADGELPGIPGYCISGGILVRAGAWETFDAGNNPNNWHKVLQAYGTSEVVPAGKPVYFKTSVVSKYPLSPARPVGHADFNSEAFWTAAYNVAVAAGTMAAGLTYNVDYPVRQQIIFRRTFDQQTIDTNPVALSDVVSDLMLEAGYAGSDFEVTDLAGQEVIGFVRTRVMPARASIDVLRQAKFFDGIESDGKIKFRRRGQAIVRSFTDDELGATVDGEGFTSKVTTSNTDETELPRIVRVHYISEARDYESGEQKSPPRLETEATNDTDVELPIVLEDDEAAQIAQVLWAEAWTGATGHEISVDFGEQEIEPADAIEIPVDGVMRRCRVVDTEDHIPAKRVLSLIRDDDGSYVSYAVADTPAYSGQVLGINGPAELVLLDLPALRDADDDPGFYAAARPLLTTATFRGARLMKSPDGGASFADLQAIPSATTMGTLVNALGDSEWSTWDEANTLTVSLEYGSLESRTEAAVLGGANAAAIGADGRWEIVQFRDAVNVGSGVWQLSGLLRGRRGTEHNVGSSQAGDRFVLLSGGTLVRVAMNLSEVGVSRVYKAVALGTSPADAAQQTFTGRGVALKPFSPVHLEVFRESDGDLRIAWTRRGRLGQTLADGTEIPLSETTEAYEVDILVGGVVVRTLEATEQEATYTAAQQTSDLGSPTPDAIDIAVYQLSASVGRGYAGTATVAIAEEPEEVFPDLGDVPGLEGDAIVLPLTYNEDDTAEAFTWTRNGDGPRITDRGFMADGYQSRLVATSGLPSYLTNAGAAAALRATIQVRSGPRDTSAGDRLVSLCENDTDPRPKLELAVVEDQTISDEPMVAARSYTGSLQTQRICRKDWRFAFTWPEKTVGGFDARPQAVVVLDSERVLVSAHYEDNFSRAHLVNYRTGALLGWFDFPVEHYHVGALAVRSDGTVWFCGTLHVLEIDLEASLASHSAEIVTDLDMSSALTSVATLDWVIIEGVEHLVVGEYATAGTPYLYVIDPADVVTGSFAAADRIKRMASPLRVQGIAYRLGELYLASSSTGGGIIRKVDWDTFIASGADGDSYADYEAAQTYRPPSQLSEDISFDPAGNLWMPTEGEATLADDFAFLAAWYSPLTGPVENSYTLNYDGAGSVDILVNDRLFATKSWTPAASVGAISIGGEPQRADGQTNAFASARIRNVVVQDEPIELEDYDDSFIFTTDELPVIPLPLENPGAEAGDASGWTNELGTLTATNTIPAAEGEYLFFGGNDAQTTARQRFHLVDDLGLDEATIDAGGLWAVVNWAAAVFSTNNDTQALGFRFLDASLSQISQDMGAALAMTPGDTWIYRSYGVDVPATARYIDVVIDIVRGTGTSNDGRVDDISAAIYGPTS